MVGFLGDVDLAEEATQEAFARAAERWPRDGPPTNPTAWLVATARNHAIDRVRRERTLAAKTRLLASEAARETVDAETAAGTEAPTGSGAATTHTGVAADAQDAATFPDERLELIFTCCHPALATDAQVALTLRFVGVTKGKYACSHDGGRERGRAGTRSAASRFGGSGGALLGSSSRRGHRRRGGAPRGRRGVRKQGAADRAWP